MKLPSNERVVMFLILDQLAGTVPVEKDSVEIKSLLEFLH